MTTAETSGAATAGHCAAVRRARPTAAGSAPAAAGIRGPRLQMKKVRRRKDTQLAQGDSATERTNQNPTRGP